MKLRHVRPARVIIKASGLIRQHFLWIFLSFIFIALMSLGIYGYRLLQRNQVKPQDLLSFFGPTNATLDNTAGLTNFLVLGIRGEGQDSPNLADTIIFLSYNHDTKTSTMIGIPRDLWIPSLQAKINSAYHYGEEASPGAGINLAQASTLEILGLPVHYTAVINFELFKQAVDLVGGVDVDVSPGFTDPEFPIPGRENALPISSRYETIVFPEGVNHMDGATALKYVRSRHSEGDEGTDFARSARQQKVISALRQKIVNPSFLLDQAKVNALMDIINSNLITNIPPSHYPSLVKLALDTRDNPINSIPLTDQPDEEGVAILTHPPTSQYSGQWVLVAKDNNWNALKQYIKSHLTQ